MLKLPESLNPGLWIRHSRYVAEAAKILAAHCPGMDENASYILGLLHDIGRRTKAAGMRHVLDGYNFLLAKGYPDAARICLTHTFAYKNLRAIYGEWDCSAAELAVLENYLLTFSYDDYDLLIQLCDSLVLPSGFTLLEKRFVETAIKLGTNELTVLKWQSVLSVKGYFNKKLGCSVYDFLPEVIENTFDRPCQARRG